MLFRTQNIATIHLWLFICLCLVLFAQAAQGAERGSQSTDDLTSIMHEYGFSVSEVQSVQKLIETMTRSQLSPEPITYKVKEGIAKGYPEKVIIQAASRVAERFATASAMAHRIAGKDDQEHTTELTGIIAEAYAAGLTDEGCGTVSDKLQKLRAQMPSAEFRSLSQQTMLAARDLTRRQVKSQTATELVVEILNEQSPTTRMVALRKQIRENSQSLSAESSAQQITSQIRARNGATQGSGNDTSKENSSSGEQNKNGSGGGKGH